MNRLIYMVTIPLSARAFLRGQLGFMRRCGYETHVVSSPAPRQALLQVAEQEDSKAYFVPLEREISLKKDLMALWSTWQLFRQLQPTITNVGTPKAGLIGGLAATLAGVPVRVYTIRGLRLETTSGAKWYLLLWMERLACACAQRIVCVSPSLRERVLQLGLTSPQKTIVLCSGSSNGLDAKRFSPSNELREQTTHLRTVLNLPDGTPTVGFVGRFVRDKGITELVEAFIQLYDANSQIRLLLLGDYEEGDPVPTNVRQAIETHPGIVQAGFVPDTAPYYQLMDVLALPTYREGYPNAPLEAAAAGKPVVASDATGAVDAVVNEVTGLTVPVGDAGALTLALQRLIENKELAHQFGQAGQKRVLRDFQPQAIWQALDDLYQELLAEAQVQQEQKPKRTLRAAAIGLIALAIPFLMLERSGEKQKRKNAKVRIFSKFLSRRDK